MRKCNADHWANLMAQLQLLQLNGWFETLSNEANVDLHISSFVGNISVLCNT